VVFPVLIECFYAMFEEKYPIISSRVVVPAASFS
jgi:hypothetical protein